MKSAHTQTVLVVEDNKRLGEAYQKLLINAGYVVRVANDAREAQEVVASLTPDLILLNVDLPQTSGLKFLASLAPLKSRPGKVVIVTDNDDETTITEAYRLGVEHYMVKKWVSPYGILQLVKNTLGTR